jgi:hypothetical protein
MLKEFFSFFFSPSSVLACIARDVQIFGHVGDVVDRRSRPDRPC